MGDHTLGLLLAAESGISRSLGGLFMAVMSAGLLYCAAAKQDFVLYRVIGRKAILALGDDFGHVFNGLCCLIGLVAGVLLFLAAR